MSMQISHAQVINIEIAAIHDGGEQSSFDEWRQKLRISSGNLPKAALGGAYLAAASGGFGSFFAATW